MSAEPFVDVERLGGLAGFGGPGGRLRSHGRVHPARLADADRRTIEALFTTPPPAAAMPDAFRYRLTRLTPQGPQSVEVPESAVPQAVREAVRDELV